MANFSNEVKISTRRGFLLIFLKPFILHQKFLLKHCSGYWNTSDSAHFSPKFNYYFFFKLIRIFQFSTYFNNYFLENKKKYIWETFRSFRNLFNLQSCRRKLFDFIYDLRKLAWGCSKSRFFDTLKTMIDIKILK